MGAPCRSGKCVSGVYDEQAKDIENFWSYLREHKRSVVLKREMTNRIIVG
ncbi:MAG: hypothetical protein NZO16_04575 [Deltaproteobacteria bacterium]|nr:hypothetical protein [Deltaproteobacteria bacterium]